MRHKLRGRATAWHSGKQLRSPLMVSEPHARSDRAQATPGEGAAQKAVLVGSPTAHSSCAGLLRFQRRHQCQCRQAPGPSATGWQRQRHWDPEPQNGKQGPGLRAREPPSHKGLGQLLGPESTALPSAWGVKPAAPKGDKVPDQPTGSPGSPKGPEQQPAETTGWQLAGLPPSLPPKLQAAPALPTSLPRPCAPPPPCPPVLCV